MHLVLGPDAADAELVRAAWALVSPLTIARWVLEGAYSRSLLAATLPSSYPPQAPRMACRRADPC